MKICVNCDSENPDDEILCSECGMSLRRAVTGEEAIRLKELAAKPEAETRPAPEPLPSGETPTGQSMLAYRLAAALLFVGASLNILDALLSGGAAIAQYLVPIGIDVGLGIYLLRFSGRARLWVLVRAILGGIVLPILAFLANDPFTAVVMTAMQLGYSVGLVLLLTGQSKTWRLGLALAVFIAFTLGPFALGLLTMALAWLVRI